MGGKQVEQIILICFLHPYISCGIRRDTFVRTPVEVKTDIGFQQSVGRELLPSKIDTVTLERSTHRNGRTYIVFGYFILCPNCKRNKQGQSRKNQNLFH